MEGKSLLPPLPSIRRKRKDVSRSDDGEQS
jgi:hypothetical protein